LVSVSDWLRNGTHRKTTSERSAAGPLAAPSNGPSPSLRTVSSARPASREPMTTGMPTAPSRRARPKPRAPEPPMIVTGSGTAADPIPSPGVPHELAPLTTLRVGGPAERLVEARTEEELVDAVRGAEPPLLLLAGGSNVVIADEGFPGTVVRVLTRGVERSGERLVVQAGEPWDPVVEQSVAAGLCGFECLSGIPGSTGATPIQNVGAYGQEVSETVEWVRVLDRSTGRVETLPPEACGFAYRSSAFKGDDRRVVLAVAFRLERSERSGPLAYAELARRLDVAIGGTAPLADVRAAVLELRRGKGMVIDPDDPDSVSVGSFFTNPILAPEDFAALGDQPKPPAWPEPDGRVKTSAAWLIERSGFSRGYGNGRVGISSKHTLALVNRGGARTAEVVGLAREIAGGVRERFGVELIPEPTFVGHAWRAA
jgi:UDP-N-acetylmuramate dehydrogenase